MRSNEDRLRDIFEAITLIEEHTAGRRDRFDDDVVLRTAVVKWIEQLGEAATGLSPELRSRHQEVDWTAIVSMPNRLTHGYSRSKPTSCGL